MVLDAGVTKTVRNDLCLYGAQVVGPRRDVCVNGETLSFTARVYARRPLQRLEPFG